MPDEKGATTSGPTVIKEPAVDLDALWADLVKDTNLEAAEVAEGEGEVTPSPESPAGEETKEPIRAAEPVDETKPAEEMVPKTRFDEVNRKAKRAEQHAELLDLAERNPDLARRMIREGLEPRAPVAAPVATGPTPEQVAAYNEQQKQIRAYWEGKFREDPIAAQAEMAEAKQREGEVRSVRRTNALLVSQYKRDRRSDDPLFGKYEQDLDDILQAIDPLILANRPDETLDKAEALALGMYAKRQRAAIRKAGGSKALPRETRPAEGVISPAAPASPAKPTRKLTPEEIIIANRYGITPEELTAAEGEGTWGNV